MTVQIHTFARLKEFFDAQFALELPAGARVSDAVEHLRKLSPGAGEVLDACRAAIDETIVEGNTPLSEGADVYLLPPSSGG